MRTLVLSLIACAVLAGCASTQERDARYALDYVCATVSKDCSALPPPTIIYVDMPALFGFDYRGAFTPASPNIVHLSIELLALDRGQRMQIIVHEVTHYVDYHFGITMLDHSDDSCIVEGFAFSVSNMWALANDAPPRFDWHTDYTGC